MKTIEDLLDKDDPAFPILQEWINEAGNKVEVLPKIQSQAEFNLLKMNVTTHSLLGAVIYETGGILIDHGWIRIFGSGSEQMKRSIYSWNKGKTFQKDHEVPPYLFIADDVLGGLFAINGGFLGKDVGNVYYFATDILEWYPMEVGYTDFILFALDGALDEFYEDLRWKGWKQDVANLSPDDAYLFYPMLCFKEGKNIEDNSRKPISAEELYEINLDTKFSEDNK